MLSLDYRRLGFKLSLMAPDSLVLSYNNLMQYFYHIKEYTDSPKDPEKRMVDMMKLLGDLLLEIRKSMGNESTDLINWDMCEWWMSDARKYRE